MNIILTGASRGIGYETSKILAREKNNQIVAIARNKAALERLSRECTRETGFRNVHVMPFDLLGDDYTMKLLPFILAKMEKVDIVINNAGLLLNKSLDTLEEEDFDRIFHANVKSVVFLTKHLLPYFASPAHIVNIGSMGGFQGSAKFPGLSLYSASKGAVAILTECLAEELKAREVKVNCLALGSAQTEMLAQAFPGFQAPLTAEEMAAFIADFSLRGHQWFNGKILPVSLSTP